MEDSKAMRNMRSGEEFRLPRVLVSKEGDRQPYGTLSLNPLWTENRPSNGSSLNIV